MKVLRHGGLLLGLLLPALQACVAGSGEPETSREPVRWILVERRYGDIASPSAAGDGESDGGGKINPDAIVLAFQPLYPEDLTWEVVVSPEEHFVELIDVSPRGHVAPGMVVTATIRVARAKPSQLYRLSAKASQPDVRILGDTEAIVRGGQTTVFRFTSCASGRGGIAVGIEPINALDQGRPLMKRLSGP